MPVGAAQCTFSGEKEFMGAFPRKTRFLLYLAAACFLLFGGLQPFAFAGIFGTVRGIVHDAQHRPIEGAHIVLQSPQSDWTRDEPATAKAASSSMRFPRANTQSTSQRRASATFPAR